MKNTLILAGAMVASTLSIQAANVYTLDLSTQTESEDTAGHYLGGTGSTGATNIGYDAVFASASSSVSITNGAGAAGTINLLEEAAANPRFRGAGVWVDSSAWGAGTVTVTFDITNWALDNAATSYLQVYSQVDALTAPTDGVNIDLHGGAAAVTAEYGNAALTTITGTTAITGNGSGYSFSFASDGTAEGVALTWVSTYAGSGATDDFSVGNVQIDVTAVPEPSSTALLGLGGLALILRRRK